MSNTGKKHDPQPDMAVGLDIGAQSIKAVLVDETGHSRGETTRATGPDTSPTTLAAALAAARDELCGDGLSAQVACGVGVAGVIDSRGVLLGSPNMPQIEGTNIVRVCSEALGMEVAVDNDASCAALGEGWNGAAAGVSDFLLLTLGTGLGCGLVVGGNLYRGATGHGCEFGHAVVAYEGRTCGCGNRGCLEAYVSEVAARSMVAEASKALRAAVESERGGEPDVAQALFALAAGGDGEAGALVSGMIAALGAGIATAVNIFDVETIVLGGGIARGVLERRDELEKAVDVSLFARRIDAVRIQAAQHGALAGAIGAARLGMIASTR